MPQPTRWAVGALALSCLVQAATAQDPTKDPHGATSTDLQQARLAALVRPAAFEAAPPGIDEPIWRSYIPSDNALNEERIALGRALYFDKRLSADGTVSCATCHDVERGFTDQRPVSEGIRGQLGRRNAPTTMNAALIEPLFLDGRAATLEDQAKMPILNPIEMGMPSQVAVVQKLAAIPEYREMFERAYGGGVNYEDIGRAIAAFERTLIFLDSPFDRFLAGDETAISDDAKKGWILYNGKARCAACHPIHSSNPVGTNFKFHNVGVSARKQDFEALAKKALQALAADDSETELDRLAVGTDLSELGRFMITRNRSDIGAFRTLQVRNVGITAPYMHDGSMQTLWDVMDHYNRGGEENPFLDGGIEPLALSEEEIDQVVALLFTLTDRRFAAQNMRELARQRAHAGEKRPFRDTELAMRKKAQFADRVKRFGKSRRQP